MGNENRNGAAIVQFPTGAAIAAATVANVVQPMPAATPEFNLTWFDDVHAQRRTEEATNLHALAETIRGIFALEKSDLPLLSPCSFGDRATAKGSLRSAANIVAAHGIVADYDGAQMFFEEACQRLRDAGVRGLLYTSPSHRPDAPRWRVVCPLAQSLQGADLASAYADLVNVLNAVLGGALAAESWRPSQSYYAGRLIGAPDFQIVTVEGAPLDRCMIAGQPHENVRQVAGGEPGAVHTVPVPEAHVRELLGHDNPDIVYPEFIKRIAAIRASNIVRPDGTALHDDAKVDLADEWSRGALDRLGRGVPANYSSPHSGPAGRAGVERVYWTMPPKPGGCDYRSLVTLANAGGYRGPAYITGMPEEWHALAKQTERASGLLRIIGCRELRDMDIKRREMVLEPVLPCAGLAELYAWRGLGKTYLAMAMANAIATGGAVFKKWTAPKPRRVLLADGEMPAKLLQERQRDLVTGAGGMWPEDGHLGLIAADLMPEGMPSITKPEVQGMINEAMQNYDVLILDNISTLAGSLREKESDDWHPLQQWLLSLRRGGKCVMFVHHASKSGDQRGTSKREDVLDTVIALRRPRNYDPSAGADVEVHLEKARGIAGKEAAPFRATLIKAPNGGLTWATADLFSQQEEHALEALRIGNTIRAVAEMTGLSKSYVGRLQFKYGQPPGERRPAGERS